MKRILTGLQATSEQIHIGNYFGAIKPMLDLIDKFSVDPTNEFIVFIANMHSLNTVQNGAQLALNTRNLVKCYLACGLDPQKVLIFNQSDVPAHAQLKVVLEPLTTFAFMKRMHKYKDFLQSGKEDEINLGTVTYPILMAGDIILYDADIVPVGKDNKQHMEFARDIAGKFNNIYGETFKLPGEYIQEDVATVPGIDGRKMSKSYNNYIGLFDSDDILLKKVKSITTSALSIEESKNPDECNLYNIAKLFLDKQENQELRAKYLNGGLSFKYAKEYLYEKILPFIQNIRKNSEHITDEEIRVLLSKNAEKANEIANQKIKDVYNKVGFNL